MGKSDGWLRSDSATVESFLILLDCKESIKETFIAYSLEFGEHMYSS